MPLDAIKSMGAKMFLNKQLGEFGEVVDIDIDPKVRMASLLVVLKGELEKIRLDVGYALEKDAFVLERFRCEREWIELVLNRFLAGKRFDISGSVAQTVIKYVL